MVFIFWCAVSMILYAYFGYPLVLSILCIFANRPVRKGSHEPTVSVIIPAYNEEKVIAAKIKSALSMDYPEEKLDIFVVSDASSDRTDAIIQEFERKGIKYLRLEKRMGKAAALNRALDYAQSEIIVFTDASILLARSALKQIVKPFGDPLIGCVSGEDQILEGGGEGLYGKYELLIRNLESRCGSIVGASGCFYAQRRDLCPTFTEGRAPDFLSVLETVRRGFRAITEPSAVGLMGRVAASGDEFKRKVRTIIRGITALMDYPELMNPRRYGLFAISLMSHKILRWIVGWLMIVALIANMLLLNTRFYAAPLVMQLCFYGLALAGWIKERNGAVSLPAWYRVPLYFCLSNLAALMAGVKYVTGTRQELWESSKR